MDCKTVSIKFKDKPQPECSEPLHKQYNALRDTSRKCEKISNIHTNCSDLKEYSGAINESQRLATQSMVALLHQLTVSSRGLQGYLTSQGDEIDKLSLQTELISQV